MATIIDLEEPKGVWFTMDGGGKVLLRALTADDYREIRRKTVKRKAEYRKVEGVAGRFEFEEVDDDLQNELLWDKCIMAWEDILDSKGNQIPCTKEYKIALMSKSIMFARFVGDSLKAIADSESERAEQAEKN